MISDFGVAGSSFASRRMRAWGGWGLVTETVTEDCD